MTTSTVQVIEKSTLIDIKLEDKQQDFLVSIAGDSSNRRCIQELKWLNNGAPLNDNIVLIIKINLNKRC